MKHVSPLETRSAMPLPIETRDDVGDPLEAATRAVNELRSAWTTFRGDAANDVTVRALLDRIDALETRAARPGTGTATAEDREREMRAVSTYLRSGADTEMRAAATDTDPTGGYLTMPTVEAGIREIMLDVSPMRSLASVIPISTGAYTFYTSKAKRGAQWVSERGTRPQDTGSPDLFEQTIPTHELYACPATTRTMLDDARIDVASWLLNNAGNDFAVSEGEGFLTGDGVGKPKGLMAYDQTSEADFTRAFDKFQYVAAGYTNPTDNQLADALIKVMMTLRIQYRAGAKWLMNRNTALKIRQVKDSTGRYLWAPTGNLIEGAQDILLGFPVAYDDTMPEISSGLLPVAFGNFPQGYHVIDRSGIRVIRDETTQKGRILFDCYKRVGGGAGDFMAVKFLKISAS
jgi:HK97 family phage major capsid protein